MKPTAAQVAHHEAGHAVASFYLQVPIKYATIEPSPDALGHVRHPKLRFARQGVFDDSIRGIDRAERHIVILYAGPLAQRRFRSASRWRAAGGSDFEDASILFSHIAGNDPQYQRLYAKLLWRRAELLVDLRWKDIKWVAKALIEQRTLDPAGIAAAIDSAHGLKPFLLDRAGAAA